MNLRFNRKFTFSPVPLTMLKTPVLLVNLNGQNYLQGWRKMFAILVDFLTSQKNPK
jgi:hypothetical protein